MEGTGFITPMQLWEIGTREYSEAQNAAVAGTDTSLFKNVFKNAVDQVRETEADVQSTETVTLEPETELEKKVTVDGTSHPVPSPFIVIATQNPFGSAGTWMLPEAQLDRFMVCLRLGYPEIADEMEILKGKHNQEEVRAVISREKLV